MAPAPTDLGSLDSRRWEARLRTNPVVILPVGALEAHGPHLPLAADQIQAEATARALAERLPDAVVAPTIPYGVCPEASRFAGTVSTPMVELIGYARATLAEFLRMGVRRLLVLSGHAERGHMAALREAAIQAMRGQPGARIVVLSDYDFVYELRGTHAPPTDGHAGLLETSRLLALAPDRVGPDRPVVAGRGSPFVPGPMGPDAWPESVVGDTRPASAEIGRAVQEHVLRRLVETVHALLPA
ncbi:MAG: creatininase family protein [Thermoplasmata archaeon]